MATSAGWRVDWVLGKEVFTSPAGTEWVRCSPEAWAKLPEQSRWAIDTKAGTIYLKVGSAARIRKAAARKARRLERRTRRLS